MSDWSALRWVDLVLMCVAFGGAGTLLWSYVWGNAWWASRVGRALVSLAFAVMVLTGMGVVRRIAGTGVVDWPTTAGIGITAAIMVYLASAFLRERRDVRRSLTRHRKRSIPTPKETAEPGPV